MRDSPRRATQPSVFQCFSLPCLDWAPTAQFRAHRLL